MNDWRDSREGPKPSFAAIVVVVVIILTIVAGIGLSHQPPRQPTATIDVPTLNSNLSNSPRYIALKLERIVNHVEVNGDGLSVVVGSGFAKLDFEDQESAMETIGAIAGPGRGGDNFKIVDLATRKRIGTWDSKEGLRIAAR